MEERELEIWLGLEEPQVEAPPGLTFHSLDEGDYLWRALAEVNALPELLTLPGPQMASFFWHEGLAALSSIVSFSLTSGLGI